MSETKTTQTEPPKQSAPGLAALLHPGQILINLVITLLTPMFLHAAGGDLDFARMAAAETVESYRAESEGDIIFIAQIIAFGLAALGSLSLSMADDLPLPMMLRLRGNANACNRSAQQNRVALKENRPEPPKPAATRPEPEPAAEPPKTPKPATESQPAPRPPLSAEAEKQYWAIWAGSTAKVAGEMAANLPNLSPKDRASAELWINVLNDCSKDFRSGKTPPPLRPGDLAGAMRQSGL
jgi:hypothetical protein